MARRLSAKKLFDWVDVTGSKASCRTGRLTSRNEPPEPIPDPMKGTGAHPSKRFSQGRPGLASARAIIAESENPRLAHQVRPRS